MIQLFNGMQSSLSMVYDREMGNMRRFAQPAAALVPSVLQASRGHAVSLLQVYVFLLSPGSGLSGRHRSDISRLLPALVTIRLDARGARHLISSCIRQLENFAGVMNFVIFPMFFFRLRFIRCGGCRREARCSTTLPVQSIHPCRRTDPLRAVWTDELGLAGRGWRLHGCLHDRRGVTPTIHRAASAAAGPLVARHEMSQSSIGTSLLAIVTIVGPPKGRGS